MLNPQVEKLLAEVKDLGESVDARENEFLHSNKNKLGGSRESGDFCQTK